MHRQHQDARLWQQLLHLARRLDAIQLRHRDIHQDDVGLQALRLGYRLASIARLAHNLDVRLHAQHHLQACPQNGMVVGKQHANWPRIYCAWGRILGLNRSWYEICAIGIHSLLLTCHHDICISAIPRSGFQRESSVRTLRHVACASPGFAH